MQQQLNSKIYEKQTSIKLFVAFIGTNYFFDVVQQGFRFNNSMQDY